MTYSYRCAKCGPVTRNVAIVERNDQICECGRALRRVFEPTEIMLVPPWFGAKNWAHTRNVPTEEDRKKGHLELCKDL